MAGYFGYSMSNNAVEAYREGRMPISMWTKKDIIERIKEKIEEGKLEIKFSLDFKKVPVKAMKKVFLEKTEWHHTSCHYNCTDFYDIRWDLDEVTDEEIENAVNECNSKGKEATTIKYGCVEVQVWGGTRNHQKLLGTKKVIGTVKGDWLTSADTGKRFKLSANKTLSVKVCNSLEEARKIQECE